MLKRILCWDDEHAGRGPGPAHQTIRNKQQIIVRHKCVFYFILFECPTAVCIRINTSSLLEQ